MPQFRITYSTPVGTEREVIEAESIEDADEQAVSLMLQAWSNKVWCFADEITETTEGADDS